MTVNAAPAESSIPCPKGSDQPTTPDALLAHLDALGITYTHHNHKADYTVAESEADDAAIT